MTTIEKLVQALKQADASREMLDRASRGCYDDFWSDSATPIMDLVRDLRLAGLSDLATRVMNGEFDSSNEEDEAWYQREGKCLLADKLGNGGQK